MRALAELAAVLPGARWLYPPTGDVQIVRVSRDSRRSGAGDLFVAIRGTHVDGHERIAEAVARGAAAVVAERDVADPGVPTLLVPSSRRAAAELAAAWYGNPAARLPLVGITGTLGKTSVLMMLEAILLEASVRAGTIGSLGIRFAGNAEETGHTVPGPFTLQRALAQLRDGGAELVSMEVTSHALSQERVHGLRFALGVFTNLVPREHLEYHGSFEDYSRTKLRFFDHLEAGAPLVFAAGDRAVRAAAEEREVVPIGCGGDDQAVVGIEREGLDADGMRLRLLVRRPLPRVGGGSVEPFELPLQLRLLGRANATNAALAAAAALCLGASRHAVRSALATLAPPRRRMQPIHRGSFTVLDDTVGHPDSISAVMEVAGAIPHRRLHVVFAIRGRRGPDINRDDAHALAIWAAQVPITTLVVTSSTDTADERNRVESAERNAFVERLREAEVEFEERERLDAAIERIVSSAARDDLVLLLGAQGMDAGAGMLRRQLRGVEAPTS